MKVDKTAEAIEKLSELVQSLNSQMETVQKQLAAVTTYSFFDHVSMSALLWGEPLTDERIRELSQQYEIDMDGNVMGTCLLLMDLAIKARKPAADSTIP